MIPVILTFVVGLFTAAQQALRFGKMKQKYLREVEINMAFSELLGVMGAQKEAREIVKEICEKYR